MVGEQELRFAQMFPFTETAKELVKQKGFSLEDAPEEVFKSQGAGCKRTRAKDPDGYPPKTDIKVKRRCRGLDRRGLRAVI